MENYVLESANKKQIMTWADKIWDAGIHDFEVLIFISTSAIYFYNKAAYDAAIKLIKNENTESTERAN